MKTSNSHNTVDDYECRPKSKNAFILVICCLYFVQGIPIGLTFHAIPTLLKNLGLPLELISLVPLAGIFWAIKFLWAPFVENHWIERIGRRKSWIVPMQLIMVGTLICLSVVTINEKTLILLTSLLAIISIVGSTQDIATDGLAAEHSDKADLGLINAIQVSGIIIGMLLAGPFAMVAFEQIGYQVSMILLAAVAFCALLPVLFWQEPKIVQATEVNKASLSQFFKTANAVPTLLLCSGATLCGVIILALSKFILVDLSWSMSQVGMLTGVGHLLVMLVGCFSASIFIKRQGYRVTLLAGLKLVLFGGLLWIAIAENWLTGTWIVWLTSILVGFGMGFVAVSTYTYSMRFSQQTLQPATNIAFFQGTQTFGEIIFSSVATSLAGVASYSIALGMGEIIALICLFALLKLRHYSHWRDAHCKIS
ncbi:MFS transporter [Photobacterium sanguinicancri]|uniref:MFS transporter n=1 Tax=Photobacterium sanguinicancri TaxID=875932 RepID=UPI0021C2C695|nr:MFS transporter [Photobacterium sanguinicancri]